MNNDNKNEQIKNLKEINEVLTSRVNPLASDISAIKFSIDETLSKINKIKEDKAKLAEAIVAEAQAVAQPEVAVSASAEEHKEKKVEPPVVEHVQEKVVVKETTPIEVKTAEKEPAQQESKAETKVEVSAPVVAEVKIEKKDDGASVGVAPVQKEQPRTYINQDAVNKNRFDNNRQQQGSFGGNAPRPAGAPSNGLRPNTNTRPANGQYPNRPAPAGGQFGNRPAGQFGNNGGNRPFNNNGGQAGGRPFPPRPFGNGAKPFGSSMPAVEPPKDTKKKKITPSFGKDDSKKALNKRDLFKKGYEMDGTLASDSDASQTRYYKARKAKKENFTPQFVRIEHAILNADIVPIKIFSEKIGKSVTEIIKKLFDMGKVATINDAITFEDAEFVAIEYGITLELRPDKSAEDKLNDIVAVSSSDESVDMVKRPPIVTIMGHVDHGKTSLLDYIRKTSVVKNEAGGITQHIGAYTIDVNNEKITFLDTPGHEAFTSMRKRGANVTDIAIIVVAADDGIMPQTVEAINHAKDAGVAIVVAVNKIDKTDGNLDRIYNQLSTHNLIPEAWGGETMVCPVSAKSGLGVQELLENILLQAEVLELKANRKCRASGSIIEARLDKGTGPIATVLVQNGTLKVKDYVVAGTCIGRIRALTDHTGKRVKEAGPSYAVQIQGFTEVPNAGDILVAVEDEKLAKKVAQERADKERSEMQMRSNARSLDDMFKDTTLEEVKSLQLIVKADVQGSAEAVKQSLEKLSKEMESNNVKINIIHNGVGAVNESDVMLADTANAIVIAFNVRPEPKAKVLAERYSIDIRNYRIIYDVIDDITKALKGMLAPVFKETILGHAEVREVFKLSTSGLIAGSYITDGKVARNSSVRLLRDNIVIYEGKLASLRREKEDVKDVATGYECGISLEKCNDIVIGDIIESFVVEKVNND
ncbi:MAG: translation initiation factor IF-2 [Clostridia bacterium]